MLLKLVTESDLLNSLEKLISSKDENQQHTQSTYIALKRMQKQWFYTQQARLKSKPLLDKVC